MATLADIRAKLLAQENKSQGGKGSSDNSLYPFWNIAEGDTAVIRFLPDADTSNSFFWVERAQIRLPFAGIKGQPNSKPVVVQVPCMEMWGEACPILAEVRPWFKDPSLEELGRKYWKKRNYLFQGFVRKDPMNEENTPDNPIRKFVITPQVFNLIKAALMDPELEDMPIDYDNGLDFHITKTSKGGYSDYSTSKWSRKTSALTPQELEAVAAHGLFDLKTLLPRKPTEVELKAMVEMFEASVDGQEYDPEKWSQYYKPFGLRDNADAEVGDAKPVAVSVPKAAATKPAPEPTVEEDDTPAPAAAAPAAAPKAATGGKAEDILALIRSRQKAAG